jgi:hypothetical protein
VFCQAVKEWLSCGLKYQAVKERLSCVLQGSEGVVVMCSERQ